MAIANAIGSNVFDILLGLGLPWTLKTVFTSSTIPVERNEIAKSVLILLGALILFVLVLILNKWTMSPKLGFNLFAIYLVYIVYTLVDQYYFVDITFTPKS